MYDKNNKDNSLKYHIIEESIRAMNYCINICSIIFKVSSAGSQCGLFHKQSRSKLYHRIFLLRTVIITVCLEGGWCAMRK